MKLKNFFINSLKTKFVGFYIVFIIIPFSLSCLWIFNVLTRESKANAGEFIINNLKTTSINTDAILKNVEFAHTSLFSDNDLISNVKYLNTVDNRKNYTDYDSMSYINNALKKITISNSYISSIYLYSFNGKTLFSSNSTESIINYFSLSTSQWYKSYKDNPDKQKWIITNSIDNTDKIISSYRPMRELPNPSEIGILSVNINENIILNLLGQQKFKSTGYSLVTDDNLNIISNNRDINVNDIKSVIKAIPKHSKQGYFTVKIGKNTTFAAYVISDYTGFKYIAIAPMDEINTSASLVLDYAIYIFIFMIVIFIIAVFLAYIYFYVPVKKLFSAMKILEKGDFNIRLSERRSDEIGFINKNFNEMVKNLKKLIDDNYINKLLKKDAQLKSIQSQIDEHFLYNTLDSIHWIARQYNAPKICDIIFSLSRFYRLSLSSGKDLITVREIVEIINNYVVIQKMRMQEALDFICEADEQLYGVKVLKYLFQPLVENAIVHGIEKKKGGGFVRVTFRRINELLRFEVEDNGTGMDEERLMEIIKEMNSDGDYTDDCFALSNINSQIKMFYGSSYSLNIESSKGNGTRIWFDIPLSIEKRDDHV